MESFLLISWHMEIDEYAAKELNLKLDGRKKKGDLIAQVLEELSTQRPL